MSWMSKLLRSSVVAVGLILLVGGKGEAGNGPLPDLVVTGMSIELEMGGFCGFTSTNLGVTVRFANQGNAAAGPFVVDVNGTQQTVNGLAAGATGSVWSMPYVYPGSNAAIIDATSQVAESDEGNNQLTQSPPIPTLPQTCTPTPTPTTPAAPPSMTPTASPGKTEAGATATSAVSGLPNVGDGATNDDGPPGWLLASLAAAALLSLGAAATAQVWKRTRA